MTAGGHYLMTAKELAEFLHYDSVNSLYSARRRGNLPPAIQRGNSLLWQRSTVEQWLKDQEEPYERDSA